MSRVMWIDEYGNTREIKPGEVHIPDEIVIEMPNRWWEPGAEDANPQEDIPDEYTIEFDPELSFN